jgi:hypothetical protein
MPFGNQRIGFNNPLVSIIGFQQIINRSGVFIYSGPPATGNLVYSIAAAAGTDNFGNSYLAGATSYSATGVINQNGNVTLVYAPSAALGNLIASIAAAGGTDSFGNVYLAGFSNYVPSNVFAELLSGQLILGSKNPSTRLLASPTSTLTMTDALADAVSPFISLVSPGVQGTAASAFLQLNSQSKDLSKPTKALISGGALSNPCPLEVDGPISLGLDGTHLATLTTDANALLRLPGAFSVTEQAAPATPAAGFGMVYANSTDKFLHYKDENGSDFTLDGGKADITQFTVTQAVSTQLSNIWTIPSGAPLGSVWRMYAGGHAVWGSTQQQLTLIMNLAGTNVLQKNIAAAAFAASTALDWDLEMWLQITGTGGAGSARAIMKGNFTPSGSAVTAGNSATFSARQVSIAISTLVTNNFALNALWAATTGAPTITSDGSHYERVGP